jgi:predicted Zn-dependent protease/DNA-binding SARP family transcriptional activator
MKKKNRWLVPFLITLGVLGLLSLPVGYFGVKMILRHSAQAWRKQGIELNAQGKYADASIALEQYMGRTARPARDKQPDYDQYIEGLTTYIHARELAEMKGGEQIGHTAAALKTLAAMEPQRLDDRRHLVELYLRMGRAPEALDACNAILEYEANNKKPHDFRTLALKTDIQASLGQHTDALATANERLKLDPLDLKANMDCLALDGQVNRSDQKVIDLATKLQEAHPNDPRFELLRGYAVIIAEQIDRERDQRAANNQPRSYKLQREEAVKWFNLAAAHPLISDDFVQTLIGQYDRVGLPQESIKVLEKVTQGGGSAELRHLLACRQWQNAQWDKAVSALSDLDLNDLKTDPTLIAIKAMSLSALQRKQESDACRAALLARAGQQPAASAWSLILRQLIDSAAVEEKQIIADCGSALVAHPQDSYLAYFLADSHMRIGDMEVGIEQLKRVTAVNPGWNAPLVRLIGALLQRGRTDEALARAELATRDNSQINAGVAVALARAMAAQIENGGGGADELMRLVDVIQTQLPDAEHVRLLQVEALAQKAAALKEGQAAPNTPKDPAQAQKAIEDAQAAAIREAKSALAKTPPPGETFFLTIVGISQKYELGVEDAAFAACEKAHGVTPTLAYAKATYLLSTGKADGGLLEFDALQKRAPKGNELNWELARARYLDASGNAGAKAAWIALGNANALDLRVQLDAVAARSVAGDQDFLTKTISRLKALTGERALGWRMAEARLMIQSPRKDKSETDAESGKKDITEGAKKLSGIVAEYPRLAEPHVLMAEALLRLKQPDAALTHLYAAYNLNPSSVPVGLQLARLLEVRNDDRAQQVLNEIARRLRTPQERRTAAILYAQGNNLSKAIDLMEKAKAMPSNVATGAGPDLFLARLYLQKQEFVECENVLKKLLEKPDLASVQFAVSFYSFMNRPADAEKALGLLDTVKLEPGQKEFAWGMYYARHNDLANAVKKYALATQAAPTQMLTWRYLAITCIVMGQVDQGMSAINSAVAANPDDKAMAACQKKLDLLRPAAADPALRPTVLSTLRDTSEADAQVGLKIIETLNTYRAHPDQLSEQLAKLVDQHPLYLPARLQLIASYAARRHYSEAIAAAQRAMSDIPASPDAAKVAVNVCMLAASTPRPLWREMDAAARVWKERSPDEAAAADVAGARAKIGMGQFDGAVQSLAPYVSRATANPEANVDLLITYCVALARSGQDAQAQEILWPLTQSSEMWQGRWVATAMMLMPDSDLAAKWLDRIAAASASATLPVRGVIAEGYDQVGSNSRPPRPELIAQAQKWFQSVTDDPKAGVPQLLAAASSFDRHGDAATADKLYRRVLSLDPNQAIAQNNLAVLLGRGKGNMQEAQALAIAATKTAPMQPAFQDTLAEVQARSGNARAAAQAERVASDLDPDNPRWRIRLANYLLDGGDRDAAAKVADTIKTSAGFQLLPAEERQQMETDLTTVKKRLAEKKGSA